MIFLNMSMAYTWNSRDFLLRWQVLVWFGFFSRSRNLYFFSKQNFLEMFVERCVHVFVCLFVCFVVPISEPALTPLVPTLLHPATSKVRSASIPCRQRWRRQMIGRHCHCYQSFGWCSVMPIVVQGSQDTIHLLCTVLTKVLASMLGLSEHPFQRADCQYIPQSIPPCGLA